MQVRCTNRGSDGNIWVVVATQQNFVAEDATVGSIRLWCMQVKEAFAVADVPMEHPPTLSVDVTEQSVELTLWKRGLTEEKACLAVRCILTAM